MCRGFALSFIYISAVRYSSGIAFSLFNAPELKSMNTSATVVTDDASIPSLEGLRTAFYSENGKQHGYFADAAGLSTCDLSCTHASSKMRLSPLIQGLNPRFGAQS